MLLNFLITSTVVVLGLSIIEYYKTKKVDYMYIIFSCIFGYCLGYIIDDVNELAYAVGCIVSFHLVYQLAKDKRKK